MGSGGGGGSSSGKVDYPDYMKGRHETWLTEMDSLIVASNPYTGATTYDPSSILTALSNSLNDFKGFMASIGYNLSSLQTMWEDWVGRVSTKVAEAVADELEDEVIPKFKGGMRDINAVQTSSFVLGEAMIYARAATEASRHAITASFNAADMVLKYNESLKTRFAVELDYSRVVILANREYIEKEIELDVEEAKWPFYNYREAGALLGSIGGPAAMPQPTKISPLQSALGGVMTGAATGAMIGGASGSPIGAGVGAAIGGIIGGIGGLIGGL